ncbi:hypothetical protein DPMN_076699 [Dreissena polymorpha]|uniref:Uncharacterized protein n=1 Tax=Dreissena polymorpha TaxID=45954 RepID=A0A9D3YJ54_DREPO|nr:hypothetical protein DPMN_076699 [Dreissena polymorpha]
MDNIIVKAFCMAKSVRSPSDKITNTTLSSSASFTINKPPTHRPLTPAKECSIIVNVIKAQPVTPGTSLFDELSAPVSASPLQTDTLLYKILNY